MSNVRWLIWAVAAGLFAGLAYSLSPLTVWAAVTFVVMLRAAGRGLSPDEHVWFVRLVVLAFLLRIVAVAVLFLVSPHDSQGSGILFGDEAYALSRSWRMRNVLLGVPQLKYDYVTAFEGYGRSNYLWVMTYIQMLVGPAPYGLRVVNTLLYIMAVVYLFHLTRAAFGPPPAFGGLIVLLFLPTLFFWSISLLKESLYFVLTVLVLAAVVGGVRSRAWAVRAALAAAVVAGLWALRDLRDGGVVLAVSGLALGFAVLLVTRRAWTAGVAVATVLLALLAVAARPALRQSFAEWTRPAVSAHAGHVFTVGHAYKLMDEGYYVKPEPSPHEFDLTPAESARFVVRAVVSYFLVPLPWKVATNGELTYLPEHMFWYALILLVPAGAIAGFRRDPLVTCLLIAYVLPTAAVVALTTGNVGTLIRHRTLIVPYLVWVSAVGFCVLMRRLLPRGGLAS